MFDFEYSSIKKTIVVKLISFDIDLHFLLLLHIARQFYLSFKSSQVVLFLHQVLAVRLQFNTCSVYLYLHRDGILHYRLSRAVYPFRSRSQSHWFLILNLG
mgnify:CR=1 FL=1